MNDIYMLLWIQSQNRHVRHCNLNSVKIVIISFVEKVNDPWWYPLVWRIWSTSVLRTKVTCVWPWPIIWMTSNLRWEQLQERDEDGRRQSVSSPSLGRRPSDQDMMRDRMASVQNQSFTRVRLPNTGTERCVTILWLCSKRCTAVNERQDHLYVRKRQT